MVITNVTVLDPILGVVKADVGIRDGKIVGVGKAGNPSTMDGVTPGLATGTATDAISGEHLILTAAGMDTHVHYICPQQVSAALSNGITTFFGGGIGPTDGTNGVTTTNGPWNLQMMLSATEGLPINLGIQGKGNSSSPKPLIEQSWPARRVSRSTRTRGPPRPRSGRAAGRRRVRRPGGGPHRHSERIRVRRRLDRRLRGPDDPHVPQRRRGRRPRA